MRRLNHASIRTVDCAGAFSDLIGDARVGFVRDFSARSDTLLVAFGGINGGMGMPPFEFFSLASSLSVKRIFIRDVAQAWYQNGVRGLGEDIPSTVAHLAKEIRTAEASHVVFTGSSAGGYAAILFGHLLDVDLVITFSPRTILSNSGRRNLHDKRFRARLDAVCKDSKTPWFFDLPDVIEVPGPEIHIHYARWHRLDRLCARGMRDVPGVIVHPHRSKSHGLVRQLRDRGVLGPLLIEALRPPVVHPT